MLAKELFNIDYNFEIIDMDNTHKLCCINISTKDKVIELNDVPMSQAQLALSLKKSGIKLDEKQINLLSNLWNDAFYKGVNEHSTFDS